MTPSDAICALLARGFSETSIGERIGANQSTINRIRRNDIRPSWEIGQALIDLAESDAAPADRAA